MAEALLARAEVIEQHLEGQGSEAEKESLLPKLEGLRKAIGDMTAHYDAKLAEVKERNLQALQELQRLERRVKAAHASKAPVNKENQENERTCPASKETEKAPKKEKVREKKPERFAPLLTPLPRTAPLAYLPWEETQPNLPWDAWSMPQCYPCPTGQAEFFPGSMENGVHTDQLWSPAGHRDKRDASIRGDDDMSASPALTFIPTPSPEWGDRWEDVLQPMGSLLRPPSADSAWGGQAECD